MDKSESQIRRIVVERMDRCSVCHRTFGEDDVEVVSRKQDMWMMIVQCRDCHARSLLPRSLVKPRIHLAVGQLLDLAAAEASFDDVFELNDESRSRLKPVLARSAKMHDFLSAMTEIFADPSILTPISASSLAT